MSTFDFNEADQQRAVELIPADSIVPVVIKVRGDSTDGLKRSKDGKSAGVDIEMTVTEGPFTKRKLWTWLTREGDSDGHKQAIAIASGTIRAILECARGVKPDDTSEAAKAARKINSYLDLDGMQVIVRVGVEPAKNGYDAKNKLLAVITPERKEWRQLNQPLPSTAPSTAAAPALSRPAWAGKAVS
jgi:hypothetical protein